MNVGVIIELDKDIEKKFKELRAMDMCNCQLVSWNKDFFTNEMADLVNQASKRYEVDITAFWCGWPGPVTWDFYDGQLTLGLIPVAYRFQRLQALISGSDFAKKMNIRDFITHVGYIPENPFDPNYRDILVALKNIVGKCKENGQNFLFETGQETPVTLKRTIEDIGFDNVGVNLDPANLLMYGKANPIDALEILGKYVMGVHGKDGMYPIDGKKLGEEKPLGEGKVDYPKLIAKLKEVGYKGNITIEREITGEEQKKDIIKAKKILDKLI